MQECSSHQCLKLQVTFFRINVVQVKVILTFLFMLTCGVNSILQQKNYVSIPQVLHHAVI